MIHVDFETYSEADLPSVGAYHYAQHPSTKALMLGYSIDGGPVKIWDIANYETMPAELHRVLSNTDMPIAAFNAQFERLIFKYVLKHNIPAERFFCSQVAAFTLGFKGGLDQCCEQFEIGQGKYARGKQLMKLFSMPDKDGKRTLPSADQEAYQEYKQYCQIDVEIESKLTRKILGAAPQQPRAMIQRQYALDQQINDNGLPIDTDLVDHALRVAEIEKQLLHKELQTRTGLDNPNSNTQFKTWLQCRGHELPNMQKATLDKFLLQLEDGPVKEALVLKMQLG